MAMAEGIKGFGEGWETSLAGRRLTRGEGEILHVGLGLHAVVALGCEHAHGEHLEHSHPQTECFDLGQNNVFSGVFPAPGARKSFSATRDPMV